MKSLRTVLLLFIAATVGIAGCDEFPEDVDIQNEFRVTIEPVNWPEFVRLQEDVTLAVQVLDENGRVVTDPPLTWQNASPASLSLGGTGKLVRGGTGAGLGWATVQLTIEGEPFRSLTVRDSIPVVLAGVVLGAPSQDTIVTSLEDTVTLAGFGQNVSGGAVSNTNLQWRVSGAGAVQALETSGDQIRVVARGDGVDTVYVTHSACQGVCEQSVLVSVSQQADTVAVSPTQDTLVAEDQLQLQAAARDARRFDVSGEVFTWSSSAETIATVDPSTGLVTAQGPGSVDIIATARSGVADSTSLVVLESGVMEVQLTDAPADQLQNAVLYLGGAYVLDAQATGGRRYIMENAFQVDLLTLADTVTVLGDRRVPAGTYGDIFLQVDSAKLTLISGLTFSDGLATRVLTPPTGSQDSLAASVSGTVTVANGDTVRILIDFDVDQSFPMPEPEVGVVSAVEFQPTTRTLKKEEGAFITGTVGTTGTAQVDSLTLRAVRTDLAGDTIHARTALDGTFKFRYLIPGDYTIVVPSAPACHLANPASQAVSVLAGQVLTGANFSIDPVTVDSIVVAPGSDTINALGYRTQLGATAYEGVTAQPGIDFAWTSLNPAVATVDREGLVTAVATGTVGVVAESCGRADTAYVHVRQVAAAVSVTPPSVELEAGTTQQFAAVLQDSAGADIAGGTFQWTSSDTTVVTIDASTGLATAQRSGSVNIRATEAGSALSGMALMSVALGPTTEIQAGSSFGCGLTQSGEVSCWGSSWAGQLGFFPTDHSEVYRPQTIPLPAGTWVDLAVGANHACALNSAGQTYCWGEGTSGELGNGGYSNAAAPVLVSSTVTFTSIAAGYRFTCAIGSDSATYCWGSGGEGQLGNGQWGTYATPQPVQAFGDAVFTELSLAENSACGLNASGVTYCWGNNQYGQLGTGDFNYANVPTVVAMPTGVAFTELGAGAHHYCAVTSAGQAWCWGRSGERQLGIDDFNNQPAPVQVALTAALVDIEATTRSTCGVTAAGEGYCWGWNMQGQFGDGLLAESGTSLPKAGMTGSVFQSLHGGDETFCALTSTGEPYCWGSKGHGLTGTGEASWTDTPHAVSLPAAVADADMADGGEATCALTSTNRLFCWGWTVHWNAINWNTVNAPEEVTLPAGLTFTEVSYGGMHLCVLSDQGSIFCRGNNDNGRLGDGTYNWSGQQWTQVAAAAGVAFTSLDGGTHHTCAMAADSSLWCWGWNPNGQIGDNTSSNDKIEPTLVLEPAGKDWAGFSAGEGHTCATATTGEAYCWGAGWYGELGDGTWGSYPYPRLVAGGHLWQRVAAGNSFTCGLDTAGAAWCWGADWYGRLGNSTNGDAGSPVAVSGGHVFVDIYVTESNVACGVLADGSALCWGDNGTGSLGAGDLQHMDVPRQSYLGIGVTLFIGGANSTCAVNSAGTMYCAGWHGNGRTGVGEFDGDWHPVRVGGSGN